MKKFVSSVALLGTLAVGCNDAKSYKQGETWEQQVSTPMHHDALSGFPAVFAEQKAVIAQELRDSIAALKKRGETTDREQIALDALDPCFLDHEGNPVDLEALQKGPLRGHYTTLSFMFSSCGTTCGPMAQSLKEITRRNPDVKHLVISVDPFGDRRNDAMFKQLEAGGLTLSGPNANTIILYPSARKDMSGLLDGLRLTNPLQHSLGLITGSNPQEHSSGERLYDYSGKQIDEQLPALLEIDKLPGKFEAAIEKSRKGMSR